MRRNIIETVMGALVIVVAVSFVVFALQSSGAGKVYGYQVKAVFTDAAGLDPGTEVRLGGLKVGTVASQSLDMERLLVTVTLGLQDDLRLPQDSSIRVEPDGLLGGSVLVVQPGTSDEVVPPGGEITNTRAAVNVVDVIGQTIFSAGGGQSSGAGGGW